jgi:DNA-binding MarR family transcriptional regulator
MGGLRSGYGSGDLVDGGGIGAYNCTMQPLRHTSVGEVSAERCAGELLASVPSVMRFIRHEMRARRRARLSVPQFRALVFMARSEDVSLSATAEHLGLSPAATSRMVDALVGRGLAERRAGADDRRRVSLSLTARGRRTYQAAHREMQRALARRFGVFSGRQRALIQEAMRLLSRAFVPAGARGGDGAGGGASR